MSNVKSPVVVAGTSVLSAIAASFCCITPLIAMLAGSSIASNVSWLEPARPYLIGLSIGVLVFAWYQQLKPAKPVTPDCSCETTKNASFWQSKKLMGIITIFALLMMTFPLYAKVFYPQSHKSGVTIAQVENKQQAKFSIQGMTCKGCEEHVNAELAKVPGIIGYRTSYETKSCLVTFDKAKTDAKTIAAAISKTGYQVKKFELMGKLK